MSRLSINASAEQAAPVLERVAAIDSEIAALEANRQSALAGTNAVADRMVQPLLDERAVLVAQLEPWWAKAAAALTGGKRKSVELGGCMIGTKAGSTSLAHGAEDDQAAVALLDGERWAKDLLTVKVSLDRKAILKALTGKHGPKLAELGFRPSTAPEAFFVRGVVQQGVVSAG